MLVRSNLPRRVSRPLLMVSPGSLQRSHLGKVGLKVFRSWWSLPQSSIGLNFQADEMSLEKKPFVRMLWTQSPPEGALSNDFAKNVEERLKQLEDEVSGLKEDVSEMKADISDMKHERYIRSDIRKGHSEIAESLIINGIHPIISVFQGGGNVSWISDGEYRSMTADVDRQLAAGRSVASAILGLMQPILTCLVRAPGSAKPNLPSITALSDQGREEWSRAVRDKKDSYLKDGGLEKHPKLEWFLSAVERLFEMTEQQQVDALRKNDGLGLTFLMLLAQKQFNSVSFDDEVPVDVWGFIVRTIVADLRPELIFSKNATIVRLGEIKPHPKDWNTPNAKMQKLELALNMTAELLEFGPLMFERLTHLPRQAKTSTLSDEDERRRYGRVYH